MQLVLFLSKLPVSPRSRVPAARQIAKSTLSETKRTEPSPHRHIDATCVSAASAHNGMFTRRIGDRAARATIDRSPVRRSDVVVHRGWNKMRTANRSKNRCLAASVPRIEIESTIQLRPCAWQAAYMVSASTSPVGRLSMFVMSDALGSVLAKFAPVPFVRSEKKAVLESPSVNRASCQSLSNRKTRRFLGKRTLPQNVAP